MTAPSLQDGIDQAGSPIALLWKPNADPWKVPEVPPEFTGWREEQRAWDSGTSLADLSHHMTDLFIEGPDAGRLLAMTSINNYREFAIGQAKQFVAVTAEGLMVGDGIVMRNAENAYTLTGVPVVHNWVQYHAQQQKYDASFRLDPDTEFRRGGDPVLFRYQVQGKEALAVVADAFGGPLPSVKFFHSTPVSLAGRQFRALRHGMAGQPGYEFAGSYADHEPILDALIRAGERYDLKRIGGLCYSTSAIASGWVPAPTPAIYTAPALGDYRKWLSLYSFEGQNPLHGSFFSKDIATFYTSPFELGYDRFIDFNHDFIGRDALRHKDVLPNRVKVSLLFNPDDVSGLMAEESFILKNANYSVERGSSLVGRTFLSAFMAPLNTVLALGVVDQEAAAPGTAVSIVWGEHPGPLGPVNGSAAFKRLRATVQPVPFNEYARTKYRVA